MQCCLGALYVASVVLSCLYLLISYPKTVFWTQITKLIQSCHNIAQFIS